MPFTPLRLLLVHDSEKGLTPKVVPDMVRRLEQRAFEVDVFSLEAVSYTHLTLPTNREV